MGILLYFFNYGVIVAKNSEELKNILSPRTQGMRVGARHACDTFVFAGMARSYSTLAILVISARDIFYSDRTG